MSLDRKVLGAVLAIFLLATWLTTRSTLWDRDEPRFAQASVEMVESGQWLYPTFNGELRPDKPILIYWLMSVPLALFGKSDWAVRAWAPVGLALSAWLAWRIGRRFLPPRAAAWAPAVLACMPVAFAEGSVATTDAVLLAAITSALACFAAMLASGARAIHFVGLALALGAAQLIKGPVGLAVPLLAILAAAWLLRGRGVLGPGFGWKLGAAVLASVALFFAWAIPANRATGGEFAAEGLGHHVGARMTSALEGHGGTYVLFLFYYLPVLLVGCVPWIQQLPAALALLWRGRLGDFRARALLLAWIVAPFVLMSLVSTKLPHYVLPIFPALALAVAATIEAAERGALEPRELRLLRRGAWLYAFVLACFAGGVVVGSLRPEAAPFRAQLWAFGAVFVGGGAVSAWLHARGQWRKAALAGVAGTVAAVLVAGVLVLPRVEESKLAPRLARLILDATGPEPATATFGFDEPSLHFYLGTGPIRRLNTEEALATWLAKPAPGVLVLPRHRQGELPAGAPPLRELASVTGFNYSKGKPLELVALRRGGD